MAVAPIHDDQTLLASAHALRTHILACADQIEADRRLPTPLVDAMKAAKIFHMAMPHTWRGLQLDPLAQFEVLEALTMADASTGWCAYIGSGSGGFLTAFLDQSVAREMYRDVDTITGGAIRAAGQATAVPGGDRVSGRWPFGSGCYHCTWLTSGCVVSDGDGPRLNAHGMPDTRICFLPADRCDILDTWTTTGLRGSASHDYAVTDLFVPEEHMFSLTHSPIQRAEPLYAFRRLYLFGHAAIPLGIARSAIDALLALATQKGVRSGRGPVTTGLRDEAFLQAAVARAEALIGSARAYVVDVLQDLWTTLVAGNAPSAVQRARFRLCITHVHIAGVEAVDLMYNMAGGTAVYAANPFDRLFRDIHTVNQHAVVWPKTLEPIGRLLLGLESGDQMV